MNRLPFIAAVAVIVLAPAAGVGGYRDLKQNFEDYAPPSLIRQSDTAAPAAGSAGSEPDGFEEQKQAIEQARDRWEKRVADQRLVTGGAGGSADLIALAEDDDRAAGLMAGRFSLETVQALVLLRNPGIKAAQARLRAALEGFSQVAQLDDILRQYAAFTEGVMPGVGPMKGAADIGMTFPFPGVTALKGEVAELDVKLQNAQFEITRRDTLAQGTKAYWNLLYTHQAIRISRDMLDRLNHLESVATTRYGAGKTSYQDVIKIRIGREKLAERLNTLYAKRTNLATELIALMDFDPRRSIGRPQPSAPDKTLPALAALYSQALAERQELQAMRIKIGRMQRMIEMAETMIQPTFSQNYSLFSDQAVRQVGSAAGKPAFATTISPTRGAGLPKNAWFGTADAYLRETRGKLKALRDGLDDAKAHTRVLVRNAWFDLDRALREQALYKNTLVDLSLTSLEVSTRGYESGSVSFADVIGSYTGWLDINLNSRRRTSDVGVARAELQRRVGARLP